MATRRTSGLGLLLWAALSLIVIGGPAGATNGMNLEGYGPVAAGMGGASMAYENGTAAVMNNPATLGLLAPGARLDVAFGSLGPDVDALVTTPQGEMTAESAADAFYMPAIGFAYKKDRILFGLGVFSQGGMGTEFEADSWLADPSMGNNSALTSGLVNRSEVSVGRVIAPFTYDVSDRLRVGASLDFVWAGMDLQMAMSEAQFQDLANPMSQQNGTASGTLVDAFGAMYEPFDPSQTVKGIKTLHHAYFDFSNDSDFTGQATATGFAGKLGAVFQATPELSFGATYHSQTSLGDLETDEATMSMGVNMDTGVAQGQTPSGQYADMIIPLSGAISVKDFQWPATYGFGLAYRPCPRMLLAADVKIIAWSDVMEQFQMVFTADQVASNGGFGGRELDAALFQEWDDQTVIEVGAAYRATDALTLRGGYNHGDNPVPDAFLNALFPAIVEDHFSLGGGYMFNETSAVDLSLTMAFESAATNPGNGTTIPAVESKHAQLNWQVMYSHRF